MQLKTYNIHNGIVWFNNDYPYHDTTLKEVIEDLYSEDIKYINEL